MQQLEYVGKNAAKMHDFILILALRPGSRLWPRKTCDKSADIVHCLQLSAEELLASIQSSSEG